MKAAAPSPRPAHSPAALFAAVVVAALMWFAPPPARGAEVSVVQKLDPSLNTDRLAFQAGSGESNQITISRTGNEFSVVDLGATMTVGPGCSGGGAPGSAALCVVHPATSGELAGCGHDCFTTVPGTRWSNSFFIDLGDGDDLLDAPLPDTPLDAIPITAIGGPGEDSITTGASGDVIYPGDGADVIRTGPGYDVVNAGSSLDGNDVYDLGDESGPIDVVDYTPRQLPIRLRGDTVESEGESDSLHGVDAVVGGAGDDILTAGPEQQALKGGMGNDRLEGNEEDDILIGGLGDDTLLGNGGADFILGGDGDDRYAGGAGRDLLRDQEVNLSSNGIPIQGLPGEPSGGDDAMKGGDGNDELNLGPGDDQADGDAGNDQIVGAAGADTLDGGPGNDAIAGDAGPDQLAGGTGLDRILAGHTEDLAFPWEPPPTIADSWTDVVDCGPDFDRLQANPWDTASECERRSTVRAVQVHAILHGGSGAQIEVEVAGPGRLSLVGLGRSRIERQSRTLRGEEERAAFLVVHADGRTLRALHRHPVRVTVGIGFQPPGGIKRTEAVSLTLALRRPSS